jgi:site-specific DNA-cytosine methylase
MLKMNLLELFAGTRSIGKVAESLGWRVFSIDIVDYPGVNLVADIEFLTVDQVPFAPDVIWASPPCQSYSIAAVSYHRRGQLPISDFAKKSDRVVKKTLKLISGFPGAIYYIENPVGMLRKMDFMQGLDRVTITYCQYGDTRMKPTDIWSNNIRSLFNQSGWQPRPVCKRGASCHISAPRSSNSGSEGIGHPGCIERSIVPRDLCRAVLRAAYNKKRCAALC